MPRQPDNSLKYSYSVTKKSVDSFQPQFGQHSFAGQNQGDLSHFSKRKPREHELKMLKKGNINSEKIFKKNKIQHYFLNEKQSRSYAKSFYKPNRGQQEETEYLNLTGEDLVSKNPVSNITNLADESLGVSKNTNLNLYSGFLKPPGRSQQHGSKYSNGSNKQLFFEESSGDPVMNF